MKTGSNTHPLVAAALVLALHALLYALALPHLMPRSREPAHPPVADLQLLLLPALPPPPLQSAPRPERPAPRPVKAPPPPPAPAPAPPAPPAPALAAAITAPQPASMAAPPAPTAQEWALAANYPLKNSKRYRYNWGQQVRSQMGTAVEGADQGVVRFRVEIAPDGSLTQLETLWRTSAVAEQLARKAIQNMPPLPPTATGKPLIFEKTISFQPFASDGPPLYRDDCLPDPPAFRNRFAWDGQSPPAHAEPPPAEKPDPRALEECLKLLPKDSIEAESARDQRIMDQWGSSQTGR